MAPTPPETDPSAGDVDGDPVRRALGGGIAEFTTTGELAALLMRLPPDTPVRVAEYLTIDAMIGERDERLGFLAWRVGEFVDGQSVTGADGHQTLAGRYVPAVELGAVRIADGGSLPNLADLCPFDPYSRAIEASWGGDPGGMFDAYIDMVGYVADMLDGTEGADMREVWVGENIVGLELDREAARLRHAVARLRILRRQVLDWMLQTPVG